MVVCKFFLQGTCKFGNNCKFEHPQGGNAGYAYSAQRQLFGGGGGGGGRGAFGGGSNFGEGGRPNYGGGGNDNRFKWTSNDYQRQQAGRNVQAQAAPNDLITTLKKEMEEWEVNKMWPFSCVAFEKEAPCIPDFMDTSPEELRLAAYEALKNNNIQPYVVQVQSLSEEYRKKRQMLQQPTMTLKQKLIALIDDYRLKKNRSSQAAGSNISLFSSQSKSDVFGKSSTFGSGPFSTGSSTADPFSGQSSSGTSPFSRPQSQTSQNPFGAGAQSGGQSSFPTGASSGFGAPAFGTTPLAGSTGFGSSSSPGLFGTSSGSPSPGGAGGGFGGASFSSPFGGTPSGSVFGGTSSPSPAFGSQLSGNAASSGFGANSTPSLFGTSSQAGATQTGAFSGASGGQDQSSVYTPIDKLKPEELAAFQAQHFTLGSVPTKPPPKELCF